MAATPAAACPLLLPCRLDRIDQAALPLDSVFAPGPGLDGSGVHIYILDTGLRT
jgi:hypothetical protein